MLNDAVGFEKIFIATGYTDLRRGIDGLASTIKFQFDLVPLIFFKLSLNASSKFLPPVYVNILHVFHLIISLHLVNHK